MSSEDRRSSRDPARSGRRYIGALHGTIPFFQIGGAQVQIHSTLLIVLGLLILIGPSRGFPWQSRLECAGALLIATLWHELAHLKGRRWAGDAGSDQMVLTPVGGWPGMSSRWRMPSLASLLAGPVASLGLCAISLGALAMVHHGPLTLNPAPMLDHKFSRWSDPSFHLSWLYAMSYYLLAINLLPIYPLDAGQIVHVMLARQQGYELSARIVCVWSLFTAVLMMLICGLSQWWFGLLVSLVCVYFSFGLFMRWAKESSGAVELAEAMDDPYPGNVLIADPRPKRPRRRLSRLAVRRLRKLARQEALEQVQLDQILAKVSKFGIKSLTWAERRTLKRATQRQQLEDEK